MEGKHSTCLAVGAVVLLAIFCTGEVVGVTCPENYINIHEKCLLFVLEEKNWDSASVFCNDTEGELATHLDDCPLFEDLLWYIDSHKELDVHAFWVGGTDLEVEGAWKWTNGDLINMGSLYWGGSSERPEPEGGTGSNCLALATVDRHSFHDDSCSTALPFICQAQPIVKY